MGLGVTYLPGIRFVSLTYLVFASCQVVPGRCASRHAVGLSWNLMVYQNPMERGSMVVLECAAALRARDGDVAVLAKGVVGALVTYS